MMPEYSIIVAYSAQFDHGDIQSILLCDIGYPCRQYLMTPVIDPQTRPQRRYNVAQIRTRNTVERMFGVWNRLFPCLSTTLRTKLQTSLTIIVATAVLFNFIRRRNDPLDEPEHILAEEEEVDDMHAGDRRLGNAVRQAQIMQHFT